MSRPDIPTSHPASTTPVELFVDTIATQRRQWGNFSYSGRQSYFPEQELPFDKRFLDQTRGDTNSTVRLYDPHGIRQLASIAMQDNPYEASLVCERTPDNDTTWRSARYFIDNTGILLVSEYLNYIEDKSSQALAKLTGRESFERKPESDSDSENHIVGINEAIVLAGLIRLTKNDRVRVFDEPDNRSRATYLRTWPQCD